MSDTTSEDQDPLAPVTAGIADLDYVYGMNLSRREQRIFDRAFELGQRDARSAPSKVDASHGLFAFIGFFIGTVIGAAFPGQF